MQSKVFEVLKKEFPGIKKNVLLKNHITFQIGGPAEYFLTVPTKSRIRDGAGSIEHSRQGRNRAIGTKTKQELIKAIKAAKKLRLSVFVLGGGSNLLVRDKGIRGLVIKIKNNNDYALKNNILFANAGVELKKLVELSVKNSLKGLEWAGGLPGSLGGAIRGNAGAFSGEIKDSVIEVEAFDENFKVKKLSNKQSHFSYRSSIFKEKNWVVISAKLKLKKGNKKELKTVMDSHIDYRSQRHPLEYPNAGSIFKNMDFKKFPKSLQKKLLPIVKKDPFEVVPTAYLISGAGLKGKKIGKAQISKKHPNFIVNLGGAKAGDVLRLIEFIKKEIKRVYKIDLETEVQIIGF